MVFPSTEDAECFGDNSSMDIQFVVHAQCAHVDVQNLQSGGRDLVSRSDGLRHNNAKGGRV